MSANENKELRDNLLYESPNAGVAVTENELADAILFSEEYKHFLNLSKTEREAVDYTIQRSNAAGFRDYSFGEKLKAGDKIRIVNRGKAILLAIIGKKLAESLNLCIAHIDSPRLDLKQQPLYESDGMALLKTHYYGGIKKYQWTTIPLALHGVVSKSDGTTVSVKIGENDNEPAFCVTDLLPHLATEQMKKTLAEGVTGESLNILCGTLPIKGDAPDDSVKLAVLKLLNEQYGITERDFISAELEAVPAFSARDIGLDKSLVGAYGHDDRVCAYAALSAICDLDEVPEKTAVVLLADKEEIGSEGNTGMQSSFLRYFVENLCDVTGGKAYMTLSASRCLSADVTSAFDPTYAEAFEKKNTAYINKGVCLMKYTGARGKAGSNDASAEFTGEVTRLLEKNGICWQTGELGRVDGGGGGTVAAYVANLNVDVIDVGVPVLSMHAPFEVISKLDLHMTYRAFTSFMR